MSSPVLMAFLISAHNPGLVSEWRFHGGHGYAFIDRSVDFDDAADLCDSVSMDMVTPTSETEFRWLVEAAYNGADNDGALNTWFWIGAYNPEIDSTVTAWQGARGWYWAQWEWENGETWNYQDFDGVKESGAWGYDNHGAAIVVTDFTTAESTRWDSHWRIAPANNAYKVVCETR